MLVLSCKVSFVWKRSFNISWKDMKYVIQQGLRKKWFFELQARKKPSWKRKGFFSSLELEKSFLPLKILKQTKADVNGIPKNQCICPDFSRCPFSRQKGAVQSGSYILCVCENNEKINGRRKRLNYVLHVSSFSGYDKNARFPSKDMYHSYAHRISLCTIFFKLNHVTHLLDMTGNRVSLYINLANIPLKMPVCGT